MATTYRILSAGLASLFAAACLEPDNPTPSLSYTVTGTLAYRSACQTGNPAPFPGRGEPDDGRPELYLASTSGERLSFLVRPDASGKFEIPFVPPGEHRLRLRAGNLQHLWLGEPVVSLPVRVDADTSLGTVCADTAPPGSVTVGARWGTDTSNALLSGVLPVWAGAADVVYVASASVRNGYYTPLAMVWDQPAFAAGATRGTVRGWGYDGFGSWVRVEQNVRLYAQRSEVKLLRGWMPFGSAITAADLAFWNGGGAAETALGAGLTVSLPPDAAAVDFSAALLAGFHPPVTAAGLRSAIQAPMFVSAMSSGASLELGLDDAIHAIAALRITRTSADAYELALLGEGGACLAVAPAWVETGSAAALTLAFDPRVSELRGDFASGTTAWTLISSGTAWSAEPLYPYVAVARGAGAMPVATAVRFDGLSTNLETRFAVLPAPAGMHDGVTYDGAVSFVYEEHWFPAAGGLAYVSMVEAKPVARMLTYSGGVLATIYTDLRRDEVTEPCDDFEGDVMVPVSDGRAMLSD